MLHFLYPWGLSALLSLGAVTFLYFFVFRGRRIEVSSLHLWQMARSLRLEGQHKQRPPITLPFILELLAALLLSLLVAGAVFIRGSDLKHLVVILDSSASMNASDGEDSFRSRAALKVMECFDELGLDGRVTLIESGFEPRIFAKEALRKEEAQAALAQWRPSGPTHPMQPAIELARALSDSEAMPVLLTDHALTAEGTQVVAVGAPQENSGWISCRWTGPGKLFALVRHFGREKPTKVVTIYGDGQKIGEDKVDFSARSSVPLAVTVPAGVRSAMLELPGDALTNDNVLRAARPMRTPVTARIDLDDDRLRRYVARAVSATDRGLASDSQAAAVVFSAGEEVGTGGAIRVRFRTPDTARDSYVGPFIVNVFHPLTRGVDLQGVIWTADPHFSADGAAALLSAGDVPLAVISGNEVTLNIDPAGSNLFTMPAWPVFVANVIDFAHEQSPGLKRASFRLGEALSFRRPPSWQGDVEVNRPDGTKVVFSGEQIYYGRLEREGIYRLHCAGREVAAFDVNLLSEQESDLTSATSADADRALKPTLREERAARLFHREFALAVLAAFLGCWYLLERRTA